MPTLGDSLLNNPSFMFGTSLLGNARAPGAINASYGLIQQMNNMKMEKEKQLQNQKYEDSLIENSKAGRVVQEQQFQRQAGQTDQQMALDRRKMAIQNWALANYAQQRGMRLPPELFGGQGQGQGQQQPQQQGSAIVPPQSLNGTPTLPGGVNIEPIPGYDPGGPNPAGPKQGGIVDQHGGRMPTSAYGAGGVGKYGTPTSVLDNLEHIESRGNPNAIGPPIPSMQGQRAQGAYQFVPTTVDMLGKQGMKFNPFDRMQSRDAADFYIADLVKKTGSLPAAIQAYGGRKGQDSYVQRVMSGTVPGPAEQSGMQAPPADKSYMQDAEDATMFGMAGVPGAAQMMEMAKLKQPRTVPAGSYQENADGTRTFIGSPYEERRLSQADREYGLKQRAQDYEQGGTGAAGLPQKATNAVNEDRYKTANTEIQKSYDTYKELPVQYQALQRAQADVKAMIDHKSAFTPVGTAGDWKKNVVKAYTNIFGTKPSDDVVNAEDFDSAMAQLWMKAVKQVDQNPTARQQTAIMQSFGTRTNDPAALNAILEATKESLSRQAGRHNASVDQFEKVMGPDPYNRHIQLPTTPGVAASDRGKNYEKRGFKLIP